MMITDIFLRTLTCCQKPDIDFHSLVFSWLVLYYNYRHSQFRAVQYCWNFRRGTELRHGSEGYVHLILQSSILFVRSSIGLFSSIKCY